MNYLTDYQTKVQNKKVEDLVQFLGINAEKLTALMNTNTSEVNLNEYGRFDELKAAYFSQALVI